MIAPEFARHHERPVARQPLRPILKAGPERLLDQQPAKTGTIDEEVAFDARTALQDQRFDKARFGGLRDFDNSALGAHYARGFGDTAKVTGIEAGVELERIADL